MTAQILLFGARTTPRNSPIGIKVHLQEPCIKCGGNIGVIGPGCGPHAAELRCTNCVWHVRWLSERERQLAVRVAGSPHAPDVILLPARGWP
jgi:hypothetical protein